jgi:hypothetical protein
VLISSVRQLIMKFVDGKMNKNQTVTLKDVIEEEVREEEIKFFSFL